MRFQLVLASAFVAVAAAKSGDASSTAAQAATTTRSKSAVEKCVDKCDSGDVYCQAACVGVPHPNASNMNQTTDCVAACDQGDGSASDNDAYAKCRNNCISSYINTSSLATLSAGEAGPTPASVPAGESRTPGSPSGGRSGSATRTTAGSGSGASESGSSTTDASNADSTGSSDSSESSAGASSSTSTAGAFNVQAGPVSGLAGLLLALFAL